MEASSDTDAQIVRYTWVFGLKDKLISFTADSSAVSLRIAGAEQLYQVKAHNLRSRQRGALDLFSNCKFVNLLCM